MQRSIHRSVLFGLILAAAAGGGCAARQEAPDAEASSSSSDEISEVLDAQVEAWNAGSIRGFMDGYAQTDTLRFASGDDVWRGWNQTLRRYQETYSDVEMMGSLSFRDLEIWRISDEHAVAFGRWKLTRSDLYADVGGLFTLLFERGPEGWRIVHDHTSAATGAQIQDSLDA